MRTDARGGYSEPFTDYKLKVVFPENLREKLSDTEYGTLCECLADDPRPSYQRDGRIYSMKFSRYEVSFAAESGVLTVLSVEIAE